MAELGAALRTKRCACLRKKHFLFLCDTWRYRSDVWARKDIGAMSGNYTVTLDSHDAAFILLTPQ